MTCSELLTVCISIMQLSSPVNYQMIKKLIQQNTSTLETHAITFNKRNDKILIWRQKQHRHPWMFSEPCSHCSRVVECYIVPHNNKCCISCLLTHFNWSGLHLHDRPEKKEIHGFTAQQILVHLVTHWTNILPKHIDNGAVWHVLHSFWKVLRCTFFSSKLYSSQALWQLL